jgi:hypothetical protein
MKRKIGIFLMLLAMLLVFHSNIAVAQTIDSTTEDAITEISELVADSLEEVDEESDSVYQLKRIVVFAEKLVDDYDAAQIIENPEYHQFVLQFDTEKQTKTAYQLIQKESSYEGFFLDTLITTDDVLLENEEVNQNSWGTSAMGLDQLTSQAIKYNMDTSITVAIIDSGANNEENAILEGRLDSESYNIAESNTDLEDNNSEEHGTHVAEIVAESTPSNVKIMALKIFNSNNRSSILIVLSALQYAIEKNADIINMSIGLSANTQIEKLRQLDLAIDKAYEQGIPIFAAAGNDSRNVSTCYPACNTKTIAVSALDANLQFEEYSNFGTSIDFCAPGSYKFSKNDSISGTSMASPYMAAAAAMIKNLHKDYTVAQIYKVLEKYAKDLGDEGKDIYYGNGFVNLASYYSDEGIGKTSLSNLKIILSKTSYVYDGTVKKPTVTIQNNGEILSTDDYSVSYSDNKNAGTATITITGTGNYIGTVKKTFKITKASLNLAKIANIATKTYTGTAIKPSVTLTYKNKTLKQGSDYTLSYSNNINAGTATVTIKGKGNYTDTVKKTFKISKVSIKSVKVSSVGTQTYTGKAIKPTPKLTYKNKTLKKGSDYTLTYSNNKKVGTATLTITGKGNFTGTRKVTFKIKDTYTVYKVKTSRLHYRSGASRESSIKGILKKNQKIKVVNGYKKISNGSLWVKIYYKNKNYYVNSNYLTKID